MWHVVGGRNQNPQEFWEPELGSVSLTAVTGAKMAPGGVTITWTKIAPSLACLAWRNEPLVLMRMTQTGWTRSVFDEIGSEHILQSLGQMGKKLGRVTGKKKINTKSTTTWKRDKPKPNILVTWLLCISQAVQSLPLAAQLRPGLISFKQYSANNKQNVVIMVSRSPLLTTEVKFMLCQKCFCKPKQTSKIFFQGLWLCFDCASNTRVWHQV